MEKFSFLLAPDISHKQKRAFFHQNHFVKTCITAKEVLMDRHTIRQLADYVHRRGFILITKNKTLLKQDEALCRSIIFQKGNMTMDGLQQKLNSDAEKLYLWLILSESTTYIVDP